jgi:anti-sigma factor ChrR (cupin superfamily)
LEAVKQSVQSDLQYVSIQVNEKTYGGWYRVLPDGKMELLAFANVHCERRTESTPVEQARGMLTGFVLAGRPKRKANGSVTSQAVARAGEDPITCATGTLGALLYADRSQARVPETDWVGLVQSIAAGDRLALAELYDRTHRIVFTLMMRLANHRAAAEEMTLDVFHDVWLQAEQYNAADESVVAWIMNHARCRALQQPEREVVESDVLRPSESLRGRLSQRITAQTDAAGASCPRRWAEPEWEAVAPGISCKLLATDAENNRVSMLVRLAAGVDYPPHRHAGVEELHLLHGELFIDERKLFPGDYNRAEPGSADKRVWSETGCTCVLVTSTRDVLG